jgi:hypothetical protein
MAMDDDVGSEMLRRQELRLIKTFLRIKDSSERRRILDLVEQLADDASSGAAGPGAAKDPAVEKGAEVPGRIE